MNYERKALILPKMKKKLTQNTQKKVEETKNYQTAVVTEEPIKIKVHFCCFLFSSQFRSYIVCVE